MSIITRMRKQTAVYWSRDATPDEFGAYSYAAAVQIECRWDDSAREYRDAQGQTQLSQAVVYVDRVMKVGDMLKEGDLESDTVADPTDDPDAFKIQGFDKNPNIRNTETLLTAYL